MPKTIGPYRLNPRGDYNPAADPLYSLLDLVSDGGGSFVYINDTPSNEPTSSASHWQQIAEKGDTGAQGPKGDTGAQGPVGNVMYATFDIDFDTGELVMTIPDGYTGPTFSINDETGELEVSI